MIKKILFLVALILMVVGCSNPTNIDSIISNNKDNEEKPSIPHDESDNKPHDTPTEEIVTLSNWVYNGENLSIVSDRDKLNPSNDNTVNSYKLDSLDSILTNRETLNQIKECIENDYIKLKRLPIETTSSEGYIKQEYTVAWNLDTSIYGNNTKNCKYSYKNGSDCFLIYPKKCNNGIPLGNYGLLFYGNANKDKLTKMADASSLLYNGEGNNFIIPENDNTRYLSYDSFITDETSSNSYKISYNIWRLNTKDTNYVYLNIYKRVITFSIENGNLVITENFEEL